MSLIVTVATDVPPAPCVQPVTLLAGAMVAVKVSSGSTSASAAIGTDSVACRLSPATVTVAGVVPVSAVVASLPE